MEKKLFISLCEKLGKLHETLELVATILGINDIWESKIFELVSTTLEEVLKAAYNGDPKVYDETDIMPYEVYSYFFSYEKGKDKTKGFYDSGTGVTNDGKNFNYSYSIKDLSELYDFLQSGCNINYKNENDFTKIGEV